MEFKRKRGRPRKQKVVDEEFAAKIPEANLSEVSIDKIDFKDKLGYDSFVHRVTSCEVEAHDLYQEALKCRDEVLCETYLIQWIKLSELRKSIEEKYPATQAEYGRFLPVSDVEFAWNQKLSELRGFNDQLPYELVQKKDLTEVEFIEYCKDKINDMYNQILNVNYSINES